MDSVKSGCKYTDYSFFYINARAKEEIVTRGMSYKFALLHQSIIRSLWETGNKFALKNPNQVRLVAFERRFRGLHQGLISDIEDPKSHR